MSNDVGGGVSMEYLDVDLSIGLATEHRYPVSIRSPAGDAGELATIPTFGPELGRALGISRDVEPEVTRAAEGVMTARDFGIALFSAVFRGQVGGRLEATLHQAQLVGAGMRLRLRIQPPELAILPWELLYDAARASFLALSRRTVLSRYVELPRAPTRLEVPAPLRVLAIIATPSNTDALDAAAERAVVERATADLVRRGRMAIRWLVVPEEPLERLQDLMLETAERWHVVHFIGHGRYNATTKRGEIALAERDGRAHWIDGGSLANLLSDHGSIRAVILNCCRGAAGNPISLFSSTAAQIASGGVAAVIAMQRAIGDQAAIEFASRLYRSIADRLPLDAAVTEGRKALELARRDPADLEWSTPVLYMRSPDGRLFVADPPRRARRPWVGVVVAGAVAVGTTATIAGIRKCSPNVVVQPEASIASAGEASVDVAPPAFTDAEAGIVLTPDARRGSGTAVIAARPAEPTPCPTDDPVVRSVQEKVPQICLRRTQLGETWRWYARRTCAPKTTPEALVAELAGDKMPDAAGIRTATEKQCEP